MSGAQIRNFIRELFGSRLVENLETQLSALRMDCDMRLRDKDDIIASLRTEKAALEMKVTEYERALMPLQSRAGAAVVANSVTKPEKPSWAVDPLSFVSQMPKSRWEQFQEDYYKEQDRIEKEQKTKEINKEQ